MEQEAEDIAVSRKKLEAERQEHRKRLVEDLKKWEHRKRDEIRSLQEKKTEEESRLASLELNMSSSIIAKEVDLREKEDKLVLQLEHQEKMEARLEHLTAEIEAEREEVSQARKVLERKR